MIGIPTVIRCARPPAALVAIAAVLLMVGCGDSANPLEPEEGVAIIQAQAPSLWVPGDTTVAPGTTIRWVNRTHHLHTITPLEHEAWSRGEIERMNHTFEVTLTEPGSYAYFCERHGGQMYGVVRVE